jgi:hypothetical protein
MKSFSFSCIFLFCLIMNMGCLSGAGGDDDNSQFARDAQPVAGTQRVGDAQSCVSTTQSRRASAPPRGETNATENTDAKDLNYAALQKRATEAKTFCLRNKMNTDICLLADMSIHSGKKRMVVWDFNKDTVVRTGLVSHGCGSNPWGHDDSKDKPEFSNQQDSHCSAAGKYRIGDRGYSQWGIHVKYLMHGLETSNKNALIREIVLHGWDAIADEEIYPSGTPEGWGCPAVSNRFMTTLDSLLKDKKKPVLLWIYQ